MDSGHISDEDYEVADSDCRRDRLSELPDSLILSSFDSFVFADHR